MSRFGCENSGAGPAPEPNNPPDFGCGLAGGLSQKWFWAAPLVCNQGVAHVMDWHGSCDGGTCAGGLKAGEVCSVDDDCVGVIHFFHEGIVPSKMALPTGPISVPAKYVIQVFDVNCGLQNENCYSPPLTMTLSGWGDVCGPAGGACLGPPDGLIDVANDVLGVLDKFANVNNLQKARADLEPGDDGLQNGPDFKVNVANDVLFDLEAFGRASYPFVPGDPCNPD